jgi:hypothetical protein
MVAQILVNRAKCAIRAEIDPSRKIFRLET